MSSVDRDRSHRRAPSYLSRRFGDGQWVIPSFLLVWTVLVLVPLAVLFVFSFFETKNFAIVYKPSLATWAGLLESGRLDVTIRTLRIALTVTFIELLIGFPFALWLAKGGASKTTRAIVLALLTIPFFLDLSSRTIVWRAILGQNGLVNSVLGGLGLIDQPLEWILYTEWAVHFGMVLTYFPLMVLPIYTAISAIEDRSSRQAAISAPRRRRRSSTSSFHCRCRACWRVSC